MPNTWIKRTFEAVLNQDPRKTGLQLFSVWLVLGPRQIGKSSLLLKCKSADRHYINLDDLNVRIRAKQNPELFLQDYPGSILIDEIQYAPELLSAVKRRADQTSTPGDIWLTGSQSFEVMKHVQESLAGRVAIMNLLGLSDEEKNLKNTSPLDYFKSIIETSFPKLFELHDEASRDLYLESYVKTYIERDIRELLGIQKRREFEVFVKMCALRTGQVINFEDLARDSGVSGKTAKEWLCLLEDSFLIKLVQPFFTNKTKRMTKNPKLYFLDAGLAAYLSGWKNADMLRHSPMAGAIFETHLFGNLLRYFKHRILQADISFWRDRDGHEIDFIVTHQSKITPIEVKLGQPSMKSLWNYQKITTDAWQPGIVLSLSAQAETAALSQEWRLMHPNNLANIFLQK